MPADLRNRAVFFDRDGTLMEEVHYCNDPAKVRAMPGTHWALKALRQHQWKCVIVTNQSGIGRGIVSLDQYRAVETELTRQLGGHVDATYFCPDTPENATQRRKPGSGMILEAAKDLSLDVGQSFMVGDKECDIICGKSAGCRTVLVETGYGNDYSGPEPDFRARDVVDAIHLILKTVKASR